jgi:hypothetical protein
VARCEFCEAKANSKEHAIPKWISKRLGVKDFLLPEEAFVHGMERGRHPISFASHRKRMFCKACQRHFKHLEDAVIPLLEPMAKGRVVGLDTESQALLALWAAKTAVALLATAPELAEIVPDKHRVAIRKDGRVSDETWVGYFPWRGGPVFSTAVGIAVSKVDPTMRYETYSVTLTFRDIGFLVIGILDPIGAGEEINGERWPLLQFWPRATRMIVWPPEGDPFRPGEGMQSLLEFMPVRTLPQ